MHVVWPFGMDILHQLANLEQTDRISWTSSILGVILLIHLEVEIDPLTTSTSKGMFAQWSS